VLKSQKKSGKWKQRSLGKTKPEPQFKEKKGSKKLKKVRSRWHYGADGTGPYIYVRGFSRDVERVGTMERRRRSEGFIRKGRGVSKKSIIEH